MVTAVTQISQAVKFRQLFLCFNDQLSYIATGHTKAFYTRPNHEFRVQIHNEKRKGAIDVENIKLTGMEWTSRGQSRFLPLRSSYIRLAIVAALRCGPTGDEKADIRRPRLALIDVQDERPRGMYRA